MLKHSPSKGIHWREFVEGFYNEISQILWRCWRLIKWKVTVEGLRVGWIKKSAAAIRKESLQTEQHNKNVNFIQGLFHAAIPQDRPGKQKLPATLLPDKSSSQKSFQILQTIGKSFKNRWNFFQKSWKSSKNSSKSYKILKTAGQDQKSF